jgi:fermentation-respiration switch protein FrsA (DUF1100 family)
VRDVLALLPILCERQEIDATRLAVCGSGAAGAAALHAMALDRRLRAGVIGGQLALNEDRVTALMADEWRSLPEAVHLLAPGLAALADTPEVAALCAPQPLLMLHTPDDANCPIGSARDCAALIGKGYARLSGKGMFESGFLAEVGSRWYDSAREFLVRHLRAQYV